MTDNNIPNNCKPFDLAAFKRGDKAVTRDGRDPDFVFHDKDMKMSNTRLGVRIARDLILYHEDGTFWPETYSVNDLFMVRRTVKVWANAYSNGSVASWHKSEDECNRRRSIDHAGILTGEVEL